MVCTCHQNSRVGGECQVGKMGKKRRKGERNLPVIGAGNTRGIKLFAVAQITNGVARALGRNLVKENIF